MQTFILKHVYPCFVQHSQKYSDWDTSSSFPMCQRWVGKADNNGDHQVYTYDLICCMQHCSWREYYILPHSMHAIWSLWMKQNVVDALVKYRKWSSLLTTGKKSKFDIIYLVLFRVVQLHWRLSSNDNVHTYTYIHNQTFIFLQTFGISFIIYCLFVLSMDIYYAPKPVCQIHFNDINIKHKDTYRDQNTRQELSISFFYAMTTCVRCKITGLVSNQTHNHTGSMAY